MNGLATYANEAAMADLFIVLAIALMAWLAVEVRHVFSGRDRRALRLKSAAKRFVVFWAVFLLSGAGGSYYLNAHARAAATAFHTVRSDEDGGIYTARYAYISRDRILLRVYSTSDMALLAERTYRYLDAADLVWTKDSLIYDSTAQDGEGLVRLPPSLIDRLLAALP